MNIIEALNWRYAAKSMNGNTLPAEKVETILEAARLAPTSVGLQPFEIIAVSNKEWKEKIFQVANQQQPVIGSSHLLVFAAWNGYTPDRIHEFFDRNNAERNVPASATDGLRNHVLTYFTGMSADEQFQHTSQQANIGLGLAVAAAALEKVDATPMGGFNAAALDELLGLPDKGLRSVMLLALGYRDTENDWAVNLKKIRRAKADFVTELA